MERRLGVLRRLDNTGLGYQSRNLARMLKPCKTLDITHGEDIPSFAQFKEFFTGLDAVITAETPYTYEAWNWARLMGVKTFCQPNWEFFDGLVQPNMPHPDQYLIPSYWHLDDFQAMFPNSIYLPPPTIESEFEKVRQKNLNRTGKKRFVHIIGKNAMYDRNGWTTIMDCLKHCKADFELVVFSQQEMTGYADPRIKYNVFDVKDQRDLYTDFDALILPRRYGGLCLPMNEALMAGLPVVMTDISPNNEILPKEWLVPSEITARFDGRATIDVYSANERILAHRLDELAGLPHLALRQMKTRAYQIAKKHYSDQTLKSRYQKVLGLI